MYSGDNIDDLAKNSKWTEIFLIREAIVNGLKMGWLIAKKQSLPYLKAWVKVETVRKMKEIKNTKKNTFLNIFDASIRQQSGQIVKSWPCILQILSK